MGRVPWPVCKYCGSQLYGSRPCPCLGAMAEHDPDDEEE